MAKVLVTGANGFVGSFLCDVLEHRGIDHIGAVRRKTAEKQREISGLSGATDWTQALEGCSEVIHLAARVHIMNESACDSQSAYRSANVDATLQLARQAAQLGIRRFLFVSTIKVNGESTLDIPFRESDIPAPADYYSQSKLDAERGLMTLSEKTGMEIVIIRPPLVYGPGVRANFLKLMELVRTGIPLPFGNVRNRRSMVALENMADLLATCVTHPQAAGQIFLVSDNRDLSLPELITILARSMGKRPHLLPISPNLIRALAKAAGKHNAANRLFGSLQVDIAHAKKCLGWNPIETPEVALNKTVAHFLVNKK